MATANEMMEAYSLDAVDYAKKLNISLDFSEESIKSVEDLCSILYKEIPKGFLAKLIRKSPSEKMIMQVAKMLGGYIGQVMIKYYGGSWAIENFMNENTILINIDDLKTFPVGKVYKRLKNGPEDNVSHFYFIITKDLQRVN